MEQVKRSGGLQGVSPLPRELDFPTMRGDRWHDLYDMIKFPAEASNKPHDTIKSVSAEPSTKGKKQQWYEHVKEKHIVVEMMNYDHI